MSEMPQENSQNGESIQYQIALYQATAQTWVHYGQHRWTLLYNYLMMTSILLLAWAAVFTSSKPESRAVLVILALAGLLVSLLWIPLEIRATGFFVTYMNLGLNLEKSLQARINEDVPGLFLTATRYRGEIRGISGLTTSRQILRTIPAIFVLVFVALLVISVWHH